MTTNFEENKMTDCDKCTEFKTDFSLIKPKFKHFGNEISIISVDKSEKKIVKFLNEDWIIIWGHNLLFTIPGSEGNGFKDIYINQKKIPLISYNYLYNKKTQKKIITIICYHLGNKTDNILKTFIDNAPNSVGKENAPNLNNFDMNEFFKHDNYYYTIGEYNRGKVSGEQKIKIDEILFNFDKKYPNAYNLVFINSNLTVSKKDIDLFKKKLNYKESKNTDAPRDLAYNIIYKHESGGWGFSMNKSGGQKRDTKDDVLIDCSPVDINKNGEAIEVDGKMGKTPSPAEQWEKLMKNPFIQVIFGFVIIGIIAKVGQWIFKFAKENEILGKIKSKFSKGKTYANKTAAALTSAVKRRIIEPGAKLTYGRDKGSQMKSQKRRNDEKQPLLATDVRSDTGNPAPPKEFKVKPEKNVSRDPLVH